MNDLISRQAAIDALCDNCDNVQAVCPHYPCKQYTTIEALLGQVRKFVGLDVMYPDPELCTYKEYTGKPYYSIKYIENGKMYVGYGTYNPEVLSRYLREYFMPSAQPEVLACGEGELSEQPDQILYANMSDAEFEKWLYEHGICNPNIHESIPCDAVPMLIDIAISELQFAQPEIIRCKDCKHYSHPWYCEAWNNSPGFPAVSDDMFCSFAERRTYETQNT